MNKKTIRGKTLAKQGLNDEACKIIFQIFLRLSIKKWTKNDLLKHKNIRGEAISGLDVSFLLVFIDQNEQKRPTQAHGASEEKQERCQG